MLDHSPRPPQMRHARPGEMLDALADAYARGDAPHGDRLLGEALDLDLPWDQVCAAAAAGVSRRYAEHIRAHHGA